MIGKKGSGKSTSLVSLLCDPRGFKGVYHRIIIISPTFRSQFIPLWSKISSKNVTVHEDLVESDLLQLYNEQLADKSKLTLIISDDNDQKWRHIDSGLVNRLVTNSRHCGLSFIFLSQKLTQLPTSIRSQLDCLCCYSATSYSEIEAIHREFSTLKKCDFLQLFQTTTSRPYQYLVIAINMGQIKFYNSFQYELI